MEAYQLTDHLLAGVALRLAETQKLIAVTRVALNDLRRLQSDTRETVRLPGKKIAL